MSEQFYRRKAGEPFRAWRIEDGDPPEWAKAFIETDSRREGRTLEEWLAAWTGAVLAEVRGAPLGADFIGEKAFSQRYESVPAPTPDTRTTGSIPEIVLMGGTILVTRHGHVAVAPYQPVLMDGVLYVAAPRRKQPSQFAENANRGQVTVTISCDALEAAQALVERLDECEPDHHDHVRDFNGHVVPALERLKAALAVPELSDG